jgi:serine/threonine-protein kinase
MQEKMETAFAGTGLCAGDVLLGKYRLEAMLGRGGMGFVVLATHLGLGQKVAIKMLLPEQRPKKDIAARFLHEARAAAKLKSEHVVRVMDVGEVEDGAPYIVMEHLVGRDLGMMLAERGVFAVSEAVDLLLQAFEAIAEAHARGLVHRDLKPSNLFVTNPSVGALLVKLLDFGITKDREREQDKLSLTATETVIGSPRYMSPEQLKSARDVDPRSDVWSLGVILYQLLSNAFPFDADTATALAIQIASDPPKPIERLRADLPEALVAAISRALEKDRAQRFQSVLELARAIAPFGDPARHDTQLAAIERAAAVGTWEALASPAREDAGWSAENAASWTSASQPSPRVTQELGTGSRTAAAPIRVEVRPFVEAQRGDRRAARRIAFVILALALAGGAGAVVALRANLPERADPVLRAEEPAPVQAETSTGAVRNRTIPIAEPTPPSHGPVPPSRTRRPKPRDPLDVQPY